VESMSFSVASDVRRLRLTAAEKHKHTYNQLMDHHVMWIIKKKNNITTKPEPKFKF